MLSDSMIAQSDFTQQNGRFRICKGFIEDSNGFQNKSDYDHNENSTMTLSMPGSRSISLQFSSFCTEKDNDVLRIFDGQDTNATLIGTYSGKAGPGTITSKDSFITLHFRSDKSIKCSGWKAKILIDMITPIAVKFSQTGNAIPKPSCLDSIFRFALNQSIPCDSINVNNTSIVGPGNPSIRMIKAINCSNGKCSMVEITTTPGLYLNGTYTLTHVHGYRDYCDSAYRLTSIFKISISNCPIVVQLSSNKDTLCKGECIKITLSVKGGGSTKYKYTWIPSTLKGKGPFTQCLTQNTRYIVLVEDGSSTPGRDTLTIVVLSPPSAQKDTQVCYYSSNFTLRASPPGGKWKGPGIVNAQTGEFKPSLVWGNAIVYYQIGSCNDTVIVSVTAPSNLENAFCPSPLSFPVYWYWPAGGTWTGPKISSAGIFKPDTAGKYVVTYTWKGCTSSKIIYVQSLKVLKYDTVCESLTKATLTFSPKGAYPNYFAGLANYYTGDYNPSLMGGPKNYTIIYVVQGGCRDTTRLTLLPSDAGLNDTFCPLAGAQSLKFFRPNTNYSWKSKGINGTGTIYDPSWWKPGKSNKDTLVFTSPRCTDKKMVYIIDNKILQPDTLFFCKEDSTSLLSLKGVKTSIEGGKWSGNGVVNMRYFNPRITGVGKFSIVYASKGCSDTLPVVVRDKPKIQLDTSMCINNNAILLYKKDVNGIFWGLGITHSKGIFNPLIAKEGTHTIYYKSSAGCLNQTTIKVDTVLPISIVKSKPFCFKDSLFGLSVSPTGGNWSGTGIQKGKFNPAFAGQGKHKVYYTLNTNACKTLDSLNVFVNSPLLLEISPAIDSVCYGKIVEIQALLTGGNAQQYQIQWSHGQTGNKTFYVATQSGQLTVIGTDGCSDYATAQTRILVHPRIWSIATTNPPVCKGLNGWALVNLGNGNPAIRKWFHDPVYKKDILVAPAGNRYRITLTDKTTGCFGDTAIELPGYEAIQADFMLQKSTSDDCLTPLDQTATFFNQCTGGTKGTWFWGDGTSNLFIPTENPSHAFDGLRLSYKILLAIENEGGCKDTAIHTICYKDTIFAYIPNSFTPNGDGINDYLDCRFYGAYFLEFYIVNRWGQLVFKSNTLSKKWDGQYNGKDCPEGVYGIFVNYKGNHQAKKTLSSSITLLRPKS
ncbi:MAG: gliding motility-associated C-terminal domain-containing protein [Bacteroidetes bacterium]|nr:gliding motility-associated C-terminal domain-containing protein [Bacteroidota bacterium]